MKTNVLHSRIAWGETDAAGIVYYPNYFRWFDAATHELFRVMDLPLSQLMKTGIITPILGAGSDFKSPLLYDDEVTTTSTITEIRTTSFRIEHTVRRGDVVTGVGYEWRGWVRNDGGSLRAVPIPDDVRQRMESD